MMYLVPIQQFHTFPAPTQKKTSSRPAEGAVTPQHICASCGASSRQADLFRTYGGAHADFDVSFCADCLAQGRPEDDFPDGFDCGGEG